MMARLAIAVLVVSVGLSVFAADEKPAQFVVCKSSKSVRTLSVTPEARNGLSTCKVTYTKGGVPETVGEHTNQASCNSIVKHVKESLENSNWNCRTVSATTTTSSEVTTQ